MDAVLELGDACGFLVDHRTDNRQVVGALLNPVAHHFQELLAGAGDLLAGQQHRFTAWLEDGEVVHVAADLCGQRFTHLFDLAVFEGNIVHGGGEGVGEGVVIELGIAGGGQAGFQVVEPALALQQAITVQVERLLLGVDRVQAEGNLFLGIGRTDSAQQILPIAFQAIEAHLVLHLLGFVEALRQVDRLQRLTADQVVLQQRGDELGALGRIGEAVDDRDHVRTRQGFDLQAVDGLLGQAIERGVAHWIGFHAQRRFHRVDHVLTQRCADVLLERLRQQFVEHAGRRAVFALVPLLADGLPNQRR
ncbi:hypothetical protein D3C81_694720 [compost metagenome]